MEKMTLYRLTDEQNRIEDMLIETEGEITPEIAELLEATDAALAQKVDGYNHIIRRCASYAQACKDEKMRFARLQKAYENASAGLKQHIQFVMEAQGIDKLESPTCKISFRNNPESVQISDEEAVLAPYMTALTKAMAKLPAWVKVDVSINKTELRDAIRTGLPVKGAELTQTRSIVIK